MVISLTLAGCGGETDDAIDSEESAPSTGSASPTTTSAETEPTEAAGSGGSDGPTANATWEVDGESTDVVIMFCGFEGETGNDDVAFSMRAQATGPDSQPAFTFDGTIIDIGSGPIHELSVWEGGSTASPPLYEAAPQSPAEWQIDGSSVRFESEFVDTTGASAGSGVFDGECP